MVHILRIKCPPINAGCCGKQVGHRASCSLYGVTSRQFRIAAPPDPRYRMGTVEKKIETTRNRDR
jgi:hypothetical protein